MAATVFGSGAQGLTTIELQRPDLQREGSLMEALAKRRSVREYSPREVSMSDLSGLLWAANGVNRPDGHHTAATALNKEDVDVYVLDDKGAYMYLPSKNVLEPVAEGDFRELIRGFQADFPIPPMAVVLVTTPGRFGVSDPQASAMMGAVDVGIVAQNIMLYCASRGLNTVPRASMDSNALAKALHLGEGAIPLLNLPVGYPVD